MRRILPIVEFYTKSAISCRIIYLFESLDRTFLQYVCAFFSVIMCLYTVACSQWYSQIYKVNFSR